MFTRSGLKALAVLALVVIAVSALSFTAGAQGATNGITSPKAGAIVSGTVTVTGYANDPGFLKWQLDLLPSGDANQAIYLAHGATAGNFSTSHNLAAFPNGKHALRLRVVRQDSNYDEYLTDFTIANKGAAAVQAVVDTPESNKAVVRQFVEQVLNARNPNAIHQFVTTDYKRYLSASTGPVDAAANARRLSGFFAGAPDLQFAIEEMVAEGDLVAYRMTARGTHTGTFLGIPATGRKFANTTLEVVRIRNGKYAEHWGGPDVLDVLQQIGATVAPPK